MLGSQEYFLRMLENWKNALDKNESADALLIDISKTFVNINHYLLLAILKAYGFTKDTLTVICSYLKNGKQKIKFNSSANTTLYYYWRSSTRFYRGTCTFKLLSLALLSVLFIQYRV